MKSLTAYAIATPVLEMIERGGEGIVRGSASAAAYIDIDGFVVSITDAGSPLMPNGVAVAQRNIALPVGAPVTINLSHMRTTGVSIELSGAGTWDPTVPTADAGRGAILVRATRILRQLQIPHEGSDTGGGFRCLTEAVTERDAALAAEATRLLLGRGRGLTPDGDDLLGAAAATVVALGPAVGFGEEDRRGWLHALTPPDLRTRTPAISATLLELATRGLAFEPARRLLDIEAPLQPALGELTTIGSTTGWTWAAGCAATALALAA